MSLAVKQQMLMDMVFPRNEEGEIVEGLITAEQAAELIMNETADLPEEKMLAEDGVEIPPEEQRLYPIKKAMVDAFREATKDDKVTVKEAMMLGGEMMQFFGITDPVGIRILGFSDLCFPEGEAQFTTIPFELWQTVRAFASQQLEQHGDSMLASHRSHMIDVRDGRVPFGLRVGKKEVQDGDESPNG